VHGGGYDAPRSPDWHGPHDDYRTPSCSSGLCGSETLAGGGGGGGEFQSLSAAAAPAQESPLALPRGHLHTTSWPPSGTAGDLSVVRGGTPCAKHPHLIAHEAPLVCCAACGTS